MTRPHPAVALWMLAASAAFACMAATVKIVALRGVPLGQTGFYRGAISLVLMGAYMRLSGVIACGAAATLFGRRRS